MFYSQMNPMWWFSLFLMFTFIRKLILNAKMKPMSTKN